ncbi:rhodanese-like domain-containing protein [Rubritalea tangerina]|uniref:Rhodanese-like domain-containing protein n=1 Tax=Rubritalea tangerina TaxID=430798 RepID=A0ABW4ZDP4_9BACT
MKMQVIIVGAVLAASAMGKEAGVKQQVAKVDFIGFTQMSEEVRAYRELRRVSIEQFNTMAKEEGTVILDTRSKRNFDGRRIKGAVHLNFSEFSEEKLAKLIPDKNTRILIYCNNNFKDDPQTMMLKSAPLALNIPTFINLYGYGYKNVYELSDYLSVKDPRVQFEGDVVRAEKKQMSRLAIQKKE